ncbi:MAG: outer membrane lipoprotein-sorting protein [Nitrospirae bacterium]|nr:outer membrane lipoprotein-sorting protein [Nitrospirota bacterium]
MRNGVRAAVAAFGMVVAWHLGGGPLGAAEGQLTGLDVMTKTRELYLAKDQMSTVTLRKIDKKGDEQKIVTKRYWKAYGGKDGFASKTLFVTEFPPDQRGVGFLIWDYTKAGQPDDLRLYLPSLKQVRRMTTREQDDAFMGSDLTFADLGQRGLDEDTHTLLRTEKCQTRDCYVIQSVPKDQDSLYGKKLTWVPTDDFTPIKIDYYDRKGELLKTQAIEWQHPENVWAWKKAEMKNVQTSHRTLFEISDLKNNVGLADDDFTERALKTGVRR